MLYSANVTYNFMFSFNVMAQNIFIKFNIENMMKNSAIDYNREDVLSFYQY